jgi:hypothetical protein
VGRHGAILSFGLEVLEEAGTIMWLTLNRYGWSIRVLKIRSISKGRVEVLKPFLDRNCISRMVSPTKGRRLRKRI